MIDSKDLVDKHASALLKILVYGKEQGLVLLTIQDYAEGIKFVAILIYCLNAFDTIGIFAIKYSGKCWTTLFYLRVLHGGVLDAVEVVIPVSCENQLVLRAVLQVDDGIAATVELEDEFDAVLANSIGEVGHLCIECCSNLIREELSHEIIDKLISWGKV